MGDDGPFEEMLSGRFNIALRAKYPFQFANDLLLRRDLRKLRTANFMITNFVPFNEGLKKVSLLFWKLKIMYQCQLIYK